MASLRIARRTRVALLCLGTAAALAACSSKGPAEMTTAPSVTDNGKRYAYAAGDVASSQWPDPCTLLTTTSAAVAVGSDVHVSRFHPNCYFIPYSGDFPTLTVTILGIGSELSGRYDTARDQNARYRPVAVDQVGRRAVIYNLTRSPTTQLLVLAREGLFQISLRSPHGNTLQPAAARKAVVDVGRALAREFGS